MAYSKAEPAQDSTSHCAVYFPSKLKSVQGFGLSLISVSLLLALTACGEQQTAAEKERESVAKQEITEARDVELKTSEGNAPQSLPMRVQANDAMIEHRTLAEQAISDDKSADMSIDVSSRSYEAGKQASERMIKMKSLSRNHIMGQMSAPGLPAFREASSSDNFKRQTANGIMVAGEIPVSTFSIDTDTGSYTTLRRWINQGRLPEKGTVRVEEMINYFNYQYSTPSTVEQPFSVNTELAPSPYNDHKMLLRIGLKGYEVDKSQLGASNLVFLLDVSGSMNSRDKLPLLKTSLKMLSQQLSEQDHVSIVVYAGASGVVLDGVKGNDIYAINQALNNLKAGGSTNGGAGIQQAYGLAQKHFIQGGVNRVILATDGDFNVGTTDHQALMDLIASKRDQGIALTTLGFGQGNYNDHLMEQLADKGNGHYAYIDTLNEARKVLVDELSSTLLTIAKDVKIQVEFNPAIVSEYRLIGYENRTLNREDFNNDKVDAGEIGAGHRVTALYEISYVDSPNQANDKLRYGYDAATGVEKYSRDEIAFLKLRYKPIGEDTSRLISYAIKRNSGINTLAQASDDYRFSAAVAGLGQLINHNLYTHDLSYSKMIELAKSAMGQDAFGYRHEFVQLAKTARLLAGQEAVVEGENISRVIIPKDLMPKPLLEVQPKYIAPHIKSAEYQLEIDKGVQGVQTFRD
ncbi:vWA domain-containing protein [Shewanella violacea]|uniref:von Willebrand factor type A domain protein n=2 Tax=Shewanella violacea TaxID=60217 RepID=D4ZAS3_SHEVD|nr:VWA domain-containing protein [Shewanella violacea]BAG66042.1 von Willebrand factor typeA domain protein [Shewanella violacea]BAJ03118.1 von Willebrand factor type A domain protein [Shewanella violacea DSS12]